jgi:hypothetical protein
MIRYALVCAKGHSFESWFQNSAAYDKQAKRGLVECPVCGSKVEKALMAPKLSGTKKRSTPALPAPMVEPAPVTAEAAPAAPAAPAASETASPVAMMSPQEREFRAKLKELRDTSSNAGRCRKFPEEARKMQTARPRSLDLWRSLAAGGQGAVRGRHRIPPDTGAARRAELGRVLINGQ